jgi:hypothetical protein
MTTKTVAQYTTVHAVRFAGCGHITFLSDDHITERRRDHNRIYCSTCGRTNTYPDESDVEALERQLTTVKDQRDTSRRMTQIARGERDHIKRSLTAHKGHTTRIKNRIAAGVCPCCNRTFKNLARHMGNKHPDYKDS